MSIRDALTLRDKTVDIGGHVVTLSRPSALDLLETLEESRRAPERLYLWLVAKHLVENGKRVFSSPEEVEKCDAILVQKIGRECEKLYEEGRD
jgi:erythromycin esterase-like protein